MLLDTIQTELRRLELHPVNLSVSANGDRLVALRGSLLHYWKLPETIEGQSLLEVLRGLPDGAGPQTVMNALSAAQVAAAPLATAAEDGLSLRLFDPGADAENDRK